mmetsp:Transcript_2684/g.7384  ORF Transcript_2684/g.7384 Transcript_2684/m.7384 type:complete len:303 (-) Transcript_2684:18-926(-)
MTTSVAIPPTTATATAATGGSASSASPRLVRVNQPQDDFDEILESDLRRTNSGHRGRSVMEEYHGPLHGGSAGREREGRRGAATRTTDESSTNSSGNHRITNDGNLAAESSRQHSMTQHQQHLYGGIGAAGGILDRGGNEYRHHQHHPNSMLMNMNLNMNMNNMNSMNMNAGGLGGTPFGNPNFNISNTATANSLSRDVFTNQFPAAGFGSDLGTPTGPTHNSAMIMGGDHNRRHHHHGNAAGGVGYAASMMNASSPMQQLDHRQAQDQHQQQQHQQHSQSQRMMNNPQHLSQQQQQQQQQQ